MTTDHKTTPPLTASVIINNYNYGHFLRGAIDSVLSQTHAPVDIIVVDDGSTDNSADIIRSYGDRITAILKTNGGHASTFNSGFKVARGDIIFFLDADSGIGNAYLNHFVFMAGFYGNNAFAVHCLLGIDQNIQ